MDFTPELSAFQGVIVSADNVHSFSRLSAKGGNEEQIEYVVKNMLKFLEQQNYISQNVLVEEKVDKMRKFAFYLILNADFLALEQMVENDGIDGVIWTIPTIPQCLLSEMLWGLKMDKFVHEVVAFTYPQLSLEIAGALIDNLKYSAPSDSLHKLRLISSALYQQMCRLHFFNFPNNVLSGLLISSLNHFQKCLNYFVEPPNAYKLASLSKDELYKFMGIRLQSAIALLQECLDHYTSLPEFAPASFNEIYKLTFKVGTCNENPLPYLTCNSPNKPLLECLEKCNEILLNAFKALVMEVSVDIFCAWSEFDDHGKSMQQNIGELCYNLRSNLLNISVICEHPVVNMIEQISRKPADVNDLVNTSDISTIAENIKNEEKSTEWLQALIHKDRVCHDVALIELIMSNLNSLNEEESHELYKICTTHLKEYSQNSEPAKLLVVKSFQKCNIDTKNEILNEHFKDKCFNDTMESSQFKEMLTEIFNKVIAEDNADLTDILTVFLQNPQKVFTKIFSLASEASHQTEIMIKSAMLLERFSNHYYMKDTEPCIIRIAETILNDLSDNENTQHNMIKFIHGLKTSNIIPESKLLLLIIMPKLHKGLLEKNVSHIHFQCKLLDEVYCLEELMPYRAPMLAMIAQILEVVRWKITTWTAVSPDALELALQLQVRLFRSYDSLIPEKEKSWLKSKLKKLHPLNCYFYRKLWDHPGDNFIEIVSGKPVTNNMDTKALVTWLALVLPSTTQKEWLMIWDSLSVFEDSEKVKLLHEALLLLTSAEVANSGDSNRNSWECLLYCYKNFIHILRYKFLKEPLTDDQVSSVLQKLSSIANAIKEENSEQLGTVFMPLYAYLVRRKDDFSLNLAADVPFLIENKTFLEMVNRVFNSAV